jgi:hypothetical protein
VTSSFHLLYLALALNQLMPSTEKSQMMVTNYVPVDTADTYKYEMAHRFEELWLCNNGWKAEQIAVDNYPSWRKNRMKAGKINVIKVFDTVTETDSSADEKSNDAQSDDGALKNKGKGKQKAEEPVAKKYKSDAKPAAPVKQTIKVCIPS